MVTPNNELEFPQLSAEQLRDGFILNTMFWILRSKHQLSVLGEEFIAAYREALDQWEKVKDTSDPVSRVIVDLEARIGLGMERIDSWNEAKAILLRRRSEDV